MPGTHSQLKHQSVSEQASAWFVRMHGDNVSSEEVEQFGHWYKESREHAKSYDKLSLLWAQLERPARQVHAKLKAEHTVGVLGQQPGKQRYVRRLTALPALMLIILLAYRLPAHFQNWQSDYYTKPGKQLTVALNDGSRLTLNTDSALAVDFSDSVRHIKLLRGEAYFQVASDKNRPFIVANGSASARAVGTAFSVKKSGDDMLVAVSEGTVEVSAGSTDASVLVHSDQQVDFQQGRLGPVLIADMLETLAWQRGQLIFKRQPLSRVIEEVNRYRKGQIMLINARLKERIVSGVFDTADPNAVVDGIKATLKVNSVSLANRLVLLY